VAASAQQQVIDVLRGVDREIGLKPGQLRLDREMRNRVTRIARGSPASPSSARCRPAPRR
jgi:hypothetical protein